MFFILKGSTYTESVLMVVLDGNNRLYGQGSHHANRYECLSGEGSSRATFKADLVGSMKIAHAKAA